MEWKSMEQKLEIIHLSLSGAFVIAACSVRTMLGREKRALLTESHQQECFPSWPLDLASAEGRACGDHFSSAVAVAPI